MTQNVLIIGGGPAGMSTALWLKYLDFTPIILEKNNYLGGLQKLSNFENVWYLGIPKKTGLEMATHFENHIKQENITYFLNEQIVELSKLDNQFYLVTKQRTIMAKFIVIATGQTIKKQESIRNIEGSASIINTNQVCFDPGQTPVLVSNLSGKKVGVIGGGDNGLVTAIRLANNHQIQKVYLLVRSNFCGFGINQKNILELVKTGKIILYQPAKICQFKIKQDQIVIVLPEVELTVDFLCFRLGFQPNIKSINDLLEKANFGTLELSDNGYLKTDQFLRTSIPNIYACGDLVNDRDPCVATAVASGAIVARTINQDYYYQ